MIVRQFASVALAFLFLGTVIFWNPVLAEEVVGQEENINLYLYSENGVGKLHTRETGGHGDAESVNIPVIAHGGAANCGHILKVIQNAKADAVFIASMLHYSSLKKDNE